MRKILSSLLILSALAAPLSARARSSAAMEAAMPDPGIGYTAYRQTPTGTPAIAATSPTSPNGISITNAVPFFWDTAMTWLSSQNTNLTTFSIDKGSIWMGAEYVQGVNIAQQFGVSYRFSSVQAESITRNAGVAGTILSQQGGIGYCFTSYDVRITPSVGAGYDFNQRASYAYVAAEIRKAMTQRTFLGLRIEQPIYFRNTSDKYTPRVSLNTGITF